MSVCSRELTFNFLQRRKAEQATVLRSRWIFSYEFLPVDHRISPTWAYS
jgi:hypothetical protein